MTIQEKLTSELCHFCGTTKHYRDVRSGFLYTDGVHFLAENYHCYWLLGEIFIHNHFNQTEDFQVWKFQRLFNDNIPTNAFTLRLEDGDYNVLTIKSIPFSDFAADYIELWFSNDVLYLPSEH